MNFFPPKPKWIVLKISTRIKKKKVARISEFITEMKKVIRHSTDMAAIGPIIKDLVDTSVRNDESQLRCQQQTNDYIIKKIK